LLHMAKCRFVGDMPHPARAKPGAASLPDAAECLRMSGVETACG
jgi:hypothetical protein